MMYEKVAMKRKEVESSNIKSIGHSFPRRLLEIEFKDGNIYRYKGVNRKTYKDLINAESKGREFHKNIKYSYPYKKYKDKEGNKMNNKYEMLVKQAYEEIVDSFEKEASTALDRYLKNHPETNKWDVQKKLLNVKGKHRGMGDITSGAAEKFVLKAPTVGEQVRRMTKADNFGELRYLKAKKGLFPHTKFE